jgi:hypothetical protein
MGAPFLAGVCVTQWKIQSDIFLLCVLLPQQISGNAPAPDL